MMQLYLTAVIIQWFVTTMQVCESSLNLKRESSASAVYLWTLSVFASLSEQRAGLPYIIITLLILLSWLYVWSHCHAGKSVFSHAAVNVQVCFDFSTAT